MSQLTEPVVSFLLQSISNLLIEEANLIGNVRNEAQLLESELRTMHALLKDAEPKQDRAAVVKDWIIQCRELAYEADDLLERFAFKIGSRRRGGIANELKRYVCFLNEFYIRHRVSVEIQSLKTRVSAINKSFQENGMTAILISEKEGSSSSKQRFIRRTYSHLEEEEEEEDFVGMESDVHILLQQLVNENHSVVSICGMGGLGKTTIAKRVYNNASVIRHFDDRVWVCISQQWQTEDVLRGILIKLMPDPEQRERIENWRCEKLVRELSKVQHQRKCLFVLDDVWATDAWKAIKHAFSLKEKGSKIIITTRNKDVAEHIDPNGFHLRLRFLTGDESWELLRKKALKRRDVEQDNIDMEIMEALGRKISELCGGLPLALIVLGGFLATRSTLSEWELEYKTIRSSLGKGKSNEFEQVQKILGLSYNDLSNELKLCFLYLGAFPEDSEIDAEEICELWLAEGFVAEMDDAKSVLEELVERCMVLAKLSKFSRIKRRRFESCRLHELMRDLCILKAKEENFMRFIDNANDYRDGNDSLSINKFYRLVIHFDEEKAEHGLPVPKKEMMKHTRMLKLVGTSSFLPEILRYELIEYLRVLAVEKHRGSAKPFKFSHVLGKLIHLRYLSLRESEFYVDNVLSHSSLGNLIHLQTLDLRGWGIELIPNALRNLRELKYLYLPDDSNMVKKSDDPLRLDGLRKLEILQNYCDSFCEPQELFKLANLRVFTIAIGSGLDINAFKVVADYVYHSDSLQYVSIRVFLPLAKECPVFVQKLLCARSMKELRIESGSHMRSWFPEYKEGLSTSEAGIVDLQLFFHGSMESNPMETLNKLPNLRELFLHSVDVGEMISHATDFPQLRSLKLYEFKDLKRWIVDEGAFPQLRTLILQNFPQLQSWIVHEEVMPILSTLHLIGYHSLSELPEGLKVLKTLKDLKFEGATHLQIFTPILSSRTPNALSSL